MAHGFLHSSEIDRIIDNSELLSDTESDSESLDRVAIEQLCNIGEGGGLENEFDTPSVRVVDRPNFDNNELDIGNDVSDDDFLNNSDASDSNVPMDIGLDSIDETIDQVVRGDIGISLDMPFSWEDRPNEPYHLLFSGQNVGIHLPVNELQTELDVFYKFIGQDFFELVTRETNLYAKQCLNDPNRKRLKSDESWSEIKTDEIKAFFLLSLIMSVVDKPSLQSYWSKRKIVETKIFTEVIPLKKFTSIMRFLHFSNNETIDPQDKLGKIRPVIQYLEDKFITNYTPDRDISVDESLMKFRGRLSYIQFIRTKRARFGIKIFKLCESQTGYCSSFELYTGKKPMPKGVLASEEIVLKLAKEFLDKGYVIYLDNWYSSPTLFSKLLSHHTYAVGTVKMNRKYMPNMVGIDLQRGEAVQKSSEGILYIRWADKKFVNTLSTLHSSLDFQPTGHRVRATQTQPAYELCKPKVIIDYNNGMQGVDRQDQVLAYNPLMRRYAKGYHKIFFYLVDMALFNSNVIFCMVNIPKKYHFSDFKMCVAEQMLGNITLPPKPLIGRPSISNPIRLQGRHFPETIPPTDKKEFPQKRCKVCSDHGQRKEVRVQCKQCKIPLHMDGCFEAYHTLLNY